MVSLSCAGSDSSSDDTNKADEPPTESALWRIRPISYLYTTEVEDGLGLGVYRPDDGYTWLLIDVEMTNLRQEDNCLNWFIEDLDFLAGNGNRYGLRLALNDPEGYLDACYGPQQTKSGFVAFEIPPSEDLRAGVLEFEDEDGATMSLPLAEIQPRP